MRESNLKARVKHNLTYFFPMFPFDPLENIKCFFGKGTWEEMR